MSSIGFWYLYSNRHSGLGGIAVFNETWRG